MKLLLDSHALIWWDENPTRLGPDTNRACFDPANELILSAASVWEKGNPANRRNPAISISLMPMSGGPQPTVHAGLA